MIQKYSFKITLELSVWFIDKFLCTLNSIQKCLYRYTGLYTQKTKQKNSCVKTFRNFISIQHQRYTWHVWFAAWNISSRHIFYTRIRAYVRSFSIHSTLYNVYNTFVSQLKKMLGTLKKYKNMFRLNDSLKILAKWVYVGEIEFLNFWWILKINGKKNK